MPTTHGFLARVGRAGNATFRYQLFVPPDPAEGGPREPWPVVLFLHGAGEIGADGARQTTVGLGAAIRRAPERFPLLAVFPQVHRGYGWRGLMLEQALQALDATVAEFGADRERCYLTGVSMGGYGCWRLALEEPERFAALVPICGGLDSPARRAAASAREVEAAYADAAARLRRTPEWVFHGADDDIIPVAESRAMVAALQAVDAPVRYTEYPGVRHDSWTPAYAEPELVPWLLAQRRAALPG